MQKGGVCHDDVYFCQYIDSSWGSMLMFCSSIANTVGDTFEFQKISETQPHTTFSENYSNAPVICVAVTLPLAAEEGGMLSKPQISYHNTAVGFTRKTLRSPNIF